MRAGTVSALMAEFRSVQLGLVDSKGRNPRDDRHYFGLVRSVVIGVQRMVTECRDEGEKEDALGLLMAMSLLHGSETPVRLFCGEATFTPTRTQALRNAMETTANSAAPVSFRPLEWLVHSIRVEVEDYTVAAAAAASSAADATITSTPAQVRTGEEWICS